MSTWLKVGEMSFPWSMSLTLPLFMYNVELPTKSMCLVTSCIYSMLTASRSFPLKGEKCGAGLQEWPGKLKRWGVGRGVPVEQVSTQSVALFLGVGYCLHL